MSEDDKKDLVEPGVYLEGPEAFKKWVENVYGVKPVESTVEANTYMILAMSGGRPIVGSIGDYADLSNVLVHGVLGYAEGPVEGPTGKPAIGSQMGPMFHMIGLVKHIIMDLSCLYIFDANSARDMNLVREYDDQLKNILAHYSGIQLATADQMPKGGPTGIIK